MRTVENSARNNWKTTPNKTEVGTGLSEYQNADIYEARKNSNVTGKKNYKKTKNDMKNGQDETDFLKINFIDYSRDLSYITNKQRQQIYTTSTSMERLQISDNKIPQKISQETTPVKKKELSILKSERPTVSGKNSQIDFLALGDRKTKKN